MEAEVKLDKIPAKAMDALKTTETPISLNLLNFLRSNSMMRKATTQQRMEVQRGLRPAANPIPTPAKEEWARASPEEERRLKTTLLPNKGMTIPNNRQTANATCMNL